MLGHAPALCLPSCPRRAGFSIRTVSSSSRRTQQSITGLFCTLCCVQIPSALLGASRLPPLLGRREEFLGRSPRPRCYLLKHCVHPALATRGRGAQPRIETSFSFLNALSAAGAGHAPGEGDGSVNTRERLAHLLRAPASVLPSLY